MSYRCTIGHIPILEEQTYILLVPLHVGSLYRVKTVQGFLENTAIMFSASLNDNVLSCCQTQDKHSRNKKGKQTYMYADCTNIYGNGYILCLYIDDTNGITS